MSKPTFYITTPIYYPSDKLHIGHAYTTVVSDAIARFKKLTGYDVYFLTGSDEHGQKIERKAQAAGVTPKEYVDRIVDSFKDLWKLLHIEYDQFIRTTDPQHEKIVQAIFKKIYEQGDIYKSEYEGWYCTPCETFFTERQLVDGACPDCGRPVELLKEESYFFRQSKYADRLLQYIEDNPDFIQPATRRNEMISFIKQGLEDLCVSRSTFKWGIPVPMDEKHVIYVWFDALSNYITALGYSTADDALFRKYWPADLHLVGKEILRFHTITWPIILMALGLPLPKKVFGHGWLVLDGGKMSKSKGNVVDPVILCDKYGVDAVRYFLLREVPFGADGVYSEEALINRINSDLANDLGNLCHRTFTMIEKYFHGIVPPPGAPTEFDEELINLAKGTAAEVEKYIDSLQINYALAAIWKLVGRSNKYIDETAPWTLAKSPGDQGKLGTVLYNLAEVIRIVGVLAAPFMPNLPGRLWEQIKVEKEDQKTWESVQKFGVLSPGTLIERGKPLFPRIDKKEEPKVDEAKQVSITKPEGLQAAAPQAAANKAAAEEKPLILIDDFAKIDLRVVEVISAEKVENADKLLKLTVSLGNETRQIVSGIAKHYKPEELVGRKLILVANLKPAKLRGIESHGMILAASNEEKLVLATVSDDIAPGARVK